MAMTNITLKTAEPMIVPIPRSLRSNVEKKFVNNSGAEPFSLGMSIQAIIWGISAFLLGMIIDRFGPDGVSKLIKIISNKAGRLQTGFIYSDEKPPICTEHATGGLNVSKYVRTKKVCH